MMTATFEFDNKKQEFDRELQPAAVGVEGVRARPWLRSSIIWYLVAGRIKDNYAAVTMFLSARRLREACRQGREAEVRQLLIDGNDAAANYSWSTGASLCYVAAQHGHDDCVAALLRAGAEIDTPRTGGATPLYVASAKGHLPVVRTLLAAGASVDARKDNGATPLLIAAQEGYVHVLLALLRAGADINASIQRGFTPLYKSSQKGHVAVVEALLDRGAALDLEADDHSTPLLAACFVGHSDVVRALADRGACPRKTCVAADGKMWSALALATAMENEPCAHIIDCALDKPLVEAEGRLSFASVSHGRLGSSSVARQLPIDLLDEIIQHLLVSAGTVTETVARAGARTRCTDPITQQQQQQLAGAQTEPQSSPLLYGLYQRPAPRPPPEPLDTLSPLPDTVVLGGYASGRLRSQQRQMVMAGGIFSPPVSTSSIETTSSSSDDEGPAPSTAKTLFMMSDNEGGSGSGGQSSRQKHLCWWSEQHMLDRSPALTEATMAVQAAADVAKQEAADCYRLLQRRKRENQQVKHEKQEYRSPIRTSPLVEVPKCPTSFLSASASSQTDVTTGDKTKQPEFVRAEAARRSSLSRHTPERQRPTTTGQNDDETRMTNGAHPKKWKASTPPSESSPPPPSPSRRSRTPPRHHPRFGATTPPRDAALLDVPHDAKESPPPPLPTSRQYGCVSI